MVKYTVIASPGSGATFILYRFLSKYYKDGLINMDYEKGIDESHILFQELAEYPLIAHHHCTIAEKIASKYPNIKIIHLIRNGLDAEKDKYHIQLAKLWVYDIQEAIKLRDNKNYFEIRYEDVCKFPERELKRIEGFLGYSNKKALGYLIENLKPAIGKHKNLPKQQLLEIQEVIK